MYKNHIPFFDLVFGNLVNSAKTFITVFRTTKTLKLMFTGPYKSILFFHHQELHNDIQSQFLPEMLGIMLQTLHSHLDSISLEDVTQSLRACFKVLSKIQMPVAYMDIEVGPYTEDMETHTSEDDSTQVKLTKTVNRVVL